MKRVNKQFELAEEAIKLTNVGQILSDSSQNFMSQEEMKQGEHYANASPSNLHERFANSLNNLSIAKNKANKYKFVNQAEEIEKLYASAVNKLNGLENKILSFFNPCEQDFESDHYIPFNAEDIKNINLAFSMLNCYFNSCKQISTQIEDILKNIQNKFTQKCIDVVKGLKNKMKNLMSKADQTSDIKAVFEEIKLVRKITNIQNDTQLMYKEVVKSME